jgi:membrane fusion protein (multidrug efflux system)
VFNPKKVEAQNGKMPLFEVLGTKVIEQEIILDREFSGRVVAAKISEVRPQASGVILQRNFEEGSFVEKGQQLYQIDDAVFLANLESAKANLKMSNAVFNSMSAKFSRYEKLVKSQAISRQEFDDAQSNFYSAKADVAIKEAALQNAQINYNYSKVFAPISGKIGKSYVSEGALVQSSQAEPLAIITQLNPIYVDINLPSQEFFELRNEFSQQEEIKIILEIDAGSKKIQEVGRVEFLESIIEESTGSIALRAVFENEDWNLLPGLFVNTKLILGKQKALLVPQKATSINPDGSLSVFVIDDKNIVNPRKIKASKSYKDKWIVEEGLQNGDVIVLEGVQKITAGAKVSVVFE